MRWFTRLTNAFCKKVDRTAGWSASTPCSNRDLASSTVTVLASWDTEATTGSGNCRSIVAVRLEPHGIATVISRLPPLMPGISCQETCHTEGMDTYSIETNSDGGYEVRVAETVDQKSQIVGSFPTYREAQEWIDAQTQIEMKTTNASDVA